MLSQAFQFSLKNQVFDGLFTMGRYDSERMYLAAGTTAGKVMVHAPGQGAGDSTATDGGDIQYLNINRKITDLVAAPLNKDKPDRDILIVGTQTSVMA